MSEQVAESFLRDGEDISPKHSISAHNLTVEDSCSTDDSWSIVHNNSSSEESYEEEASDEEEDRLEDKSLLSNEQSHSIDEEDEEEDEEDKEHEDEQEDEEDGEVNSQSDSFSSSICLEDGSITSLSDSSKHSPNLDTELDTNTIEDPSFTMYSSSRSAVLSTSESTSHSASGISLQAVPSSTTPSVSEAPESQLHTDIMTDMQQKAEKVRQELSHKIKMVINPKEIAIPPQVEDETINFWKKVGQRQMNALMAAHVQSEFKQKVMKALKSDVKTEKEIVAELVPVQSLCNSQPLVEGEEDVIGKRFCLVCSTGEVHIVTVNGGKHQRWQCIGCKEWYEWCPVVHPVSPKRAHLLETGGWDEQPAKKEDEKQENKPDPVVQNQQQKPSNIVKANPVETIEKQSAPARSTSFCNSLIFLLTAFWMVLVFVLAYFVWKYYKQMEYSAQLLREVQYLKLQFEQTKIPHPKSTYLGCIRYKSNPAELHDMSTFNAKLWLLFSTFFQSIYDHSVVLHSTIQAQFKNYSHLDAFLLVFTLSAVCGALLIALTKCVKLAFKCVVLFLIALITSE